MGDRKTPVELTNVCVICDGSRVLVEEKAGCGICFPGGHVEPGESMQQAVIREMREETGLTIEHPRLCGVKDWEEDDGSRYLVALYRADRFSGTLRASDEGRVFWDDLYHGLPNYFRRGTFSAVAATSPFALFLRRWSFSVTWLFK